MAVFLIVVFPVLVVMGSCVVAWLLGTLATQDAEARHEGSELLELDS